MYNFPFDHEFVHLCELWIVWVDRRNVDTKWNQFNCGHCCHCEFKPRKQRHYILERFGFVIGIFEKFLFSRSILRLFSFHVAYNSLKHKCNKYSAVAFTSIRRGIHLFICQICYYCWFNNTSLIRIYKKNGLIHRKKSFFKKKLTENIGYILDLSFSS